jgi:hypothetical protein
VSLRRLLDPKKGLLFRITHVANVPWILDHGLHCRSSPVRDPGFRDIGNPDLIAKRSRRVVPVSPGGTLDEYIAFYFTPYSPMLLNIKTGYQGMRQTPMPEIAILVSSVPRWVELRLPHVLSDRHAYLEAAEFSTGAAGLERIDWGILQARDFKRDSDDLGKIERYQAEALVHSHLPVEGLLGLACHGPDQLAALEPELTRRRLSLKLAARPEWYF